MATTTQVQSLYIAYFGRPADPTGLTDWTEGANADAAIETLADQFSTSPEYKSVTEGKSTETIVNDFYVNLFGRASDVDGLKFWVAQVNSGATTLQQVGVVIGQAALNNADSSNTDRVAIESKVAACDLWTAECNKSTSNLLGYQGQAGIDAGVAYLAPVTTKATVPTEAAAAADVANLASGASASDTYTLTVNQDVLTASGAIVNDAAGNQVSSSVFKLDAKNQTIIGNTGTFSGIAGQDNFLDASGSDSDTLKISDISTVVQIAGLGNASGGAATITNIETIRLELDGAAAGETINSGNGTATAAVISGADTLEVVGSLADAGNITATAAATNVKTFDFTGLTASAGTVTITGDGSSETISGATGISNVLTGAAGSDTMNGGNLSDTLQGDAGNDTLTGNGGVDTFIYTDYAADGVDTITDMTAGAGGDAVSVDIAIAAATTLVQKVSATGAAQANGSLVIQTGTNAASVIDVSGNTAADLAAINTGMGTLAAAAEVLFIFNADTDGNGAADEIQGWVLHETGGADSTAETADQIFTLSNIAAGTDLNGLFAANNAIFV